MRVLVTGGAGFVGSHIVDGLVAAGAEVLVLDDLSRGREENLAGQAAAGRCARRTGRARGCQRVPSDTAVPPRRPD